MDEILERGYSLTDAMTTLISFAHDSMEGVSELRLLVELEAERRGITVGAAVGELAAERLKALHPELAESQLSKKR